jgi:hypothetical protein
MRRRWFLSVVLQMPLEFVAPVIQQFLNLCLFLSVAVTYGRQVVETGRYAANV